MISDDSLRLSDLLVFTFTQHSYLTVLPNSMTFSGQLIGHSPTHTPKISSLCFMSALQRLILSLEVIISCSVAAVLSSCMITWICHFVRHWWQTDVLSIHLLDCLSLCITVQHACLKKQDSAAGNWTRVFRVTGGNTNHYTTADLIEWKKWDVRKV